jgi:NAD(P)-dependent dehydrogenase (short-subunit alcohol dehydrogenase family)
MTTDHHEPPRDASATQCRPRLVRAPESNVTSDFPTSAVFRAGLADFAKRFSNQFAGDNVRMNSVLPGFIDSLPEIPERVARIPAGRYARVQELSEVIAFLVSDRRAR